MCKPHFHEGKAKAPFWATIHIYIFADLTLGLNIIICASWAAKFHNVFPFADVYP